MLQAMTGRNVDRLSEGQRECLRRVLMHQTSKDIARELGISPHTVDQRLRVAAKTLGVAGRTDAALMLARAENIDIAAYQSTLYQASDIAPDQSPPPYLATASGDPIASHDGIGMYARERQLAYQAFVPDTHRHPVLPVPFGLDDDNRLGIWTRVGWIVVIAIAAAFAFGAVLAGLTSLGSLLH